MAPPPPRDASTPSARLVLYVSSMAAASLVLTSCVSRHAPQRTSSGLWQEHTVTHDGVTLEYISVSPCERARTQPVLLVPGMNGHARSWLEQGGLMRELFRACPAQIVSVSLRGRGNSTAPSRGWTPEDHARDIAAVLGELGWRDYHMVSHSMGVAYALTYLLGEGASLPTSFTAGDYFAGVPRVTPEWAQSVNSSPRAAPGIELMTSGVLAEQGPTQTTRSFPRVAPIPFVREYSDRLDQLDVPTLVILGTQSMPPETEEMWSKAPLLEILRITHGHDVYTNPLAIESTLFLIETSEPIAR